MESREIANFLSRLASTASKEEHSVPHVSAKVTPGTKVDEVGPIENFLLHMYRFYTLLTTLPRLKQDILYRIQPIYDTAKECLALFEEFLQLPKHQLTEAISVYQSLFHQLTSHLSMLDHEGLNLDAQLELETDTRDLVMLVLNNLQEKLRLCM